MDAKYKTELCNKWKIWGNCPYGDKCTFAHGRQELRPRLRHEKYKTRLCMAWVNGYCKYGARCTFIHPKFDCSLIV